MERRANVEADRAKLQENLIEASRQAGKAEIAIGVLHNVGNVMNSVNVSTTMLRQDFSKKLVERLNATVELLCEHESDLSCFFKNDARAKHFLPFLKQLSGETEKMTGDFDTLISHIEHVKEVVEAQQVFATKRTVAIDVDPVSIVESAIQINEDLYREHGIEIKCEFEEIGILKIDRSKLLQTLVNIVKNAALSIVDSHNDMKLVTIRVGELDGKLQISVKDTGIGISTENMDRIFQHGFSTRRDRGGHGFGLHHSANAINEIGGRLSVESPGEMQGATFTVQLPMKRPHKSAGSSHHMLCKA